jgi:hypothetical protein
MGLGDAGQTLHNLLVCITNHPRPRDEDGGGSGAKLDEAGELLSQAYQHLSDCDSDAIAEFAAHGAALDVTVS